MKSIFSVQFCRLVCICLGVLGPSVWAWGTEIKALRLWPAPDHTRLVFDLTAPVEHKVFRLDSPERLVIDLAKGRSRVNLSQAPLIKTPIDAIRSAARGQGGLRIVLDLSQVVKPKSFVLKPNAQYGHRLVIDLFNGQVQKPGRSVKTLQQVNRQKRDLVIAIDAGHGGEDPGALGPNGLKEKVVVLAIAKELSRLLSKEAGFKPVLIRTGDYYVGLRKRMAKARQQDADLFVSIHADAFKSPKARGASVYALSGRGATSETARWLAQKENDADLVGGVKLADKDDVLKEVLLDLSMTATMGSSLEVGDKVLGSMKSVARLHKHQVEQAGFVVLKSPDVPAILIETGFISNPGEARKLSTSRYRKNLAKAIFSGVKTYFIKHPPPGSYLAWLKQQDQLAQHSSYRIEKGDTLSAIAQRNSISTRRLRQYNNLLSDRLNIGQIILIPNS